MEESLERGYIDKGKRETKVHFHGEFVATQIKHQTTGTTCTEVKVVLKIHNKIKREKINSSYAYENIINSFIFVFENMENEYMKERANDLKDVSQRVLRHLEGIEDSFSITMHEDAIIIADDVKPSDVACKVTQSATYGKRKSESNAQKTASPAFLRLYFLIM